MQDWTNRRCATLTIAVAALLAAGPAAATTVIPDSGDSAWVGATLLIALLAAVPGTMLIGVALGGRAGAERVVTATIASIALTSLLFGIIGYSLMFDVVGDGGLSGLIGGGSNWMLNLMGTVRDGTTIPETGFVLVQLVSAVVAVALLVALLAPRSRPGWLLAFSGLWLLLVLVPVTRWIWGGGWLSAMGAMDGAGGLTLFLTVSVSALTALFLINPPQGDAQPANPLSLLGGTTLLTVAMVALSGGATLGAGDDAAVAMLAMLACATTATLAAALLRRSLDAGTLARGLLAGVIAGAVAGDGVSLGGAHIMAVIAAAAMLVAPRLLPARLRQVDSGERLISGIAAAATISALCFALFLGFDPFGGSGYADGMSAGPQAVAQLTAVLAITGWAIAGTLIAALMVGMVLPMRDAPAISRSILDDA